MSDQTEFWKCNAGYKHAVRVLRERRSDLRNLNRQSAAIPEGEYQSCRRSLLQAIHELESLLRGLNSGAVAKFNVRQDKRHRGKQSA